MLLREDYEAREAKVLAPYAALSSQTRGRKHNEPACEFRSAFQRDRDRIIHSEAFRRLEYKTQVFVNHEGDYYRTRLTHTLEVAQISRGIARTLMLNEDLAEAIALCHDLGHTPFGHSGEYAMNKLMKDHGGFEHNHQSYRVVTLLEHRYPKFVGLNLSFEVLEGIAKHSGEYDNPEAKEFAGTGYPTLEAQVVNLADEIAYLNHDLDDGLTSGLLQFKQLDEVPLWKTTHADIHKLFPQTNEKLLKFQVIRRLIHLFVKDLQEETKKRISAKKIERLEDVRERGKELVHFSSDLKSQISNLRSFLYANLYRHPKVKQMSDTAAKIIEDLFIKYQKSTQKNPREICDYIAGMTDRFALSEHQRLCE